MCSKYNAFENVPYSLENDIVKSEQLDQLTSKILQLVTPTKTFFFQINVLPLFVINQVEKSIFRCYQLKYF